MSIGRQQDDKSPEKPSSVRVGIRMPRAVHEALRHRVTTHQAESLNSEVIRILTGNHPPVNAPGVEEIDTSFFSGAGDVAEMAAEQGVEPIADAKNLLGNFWPEDESIDEMLATIRAWRQDDQGQAA